MKKFLIIVLFLFLASDIWAADAYMTVKGLSVKAVVEKINKEVKRVESLDLPEKIKFVSFLKHQNMVGHGALLFFSGPEESLKKVTGLMPFSGKELKLKVSYQAGKGLTIRNVTQEFTFKNAASLFSFVEQYRCFSQNFRIKEFLTKFPPWENCWNDGWGYGPEYGFQLYEKFNELQIELLKHSYKNGR